MKKYRKTSLRGALSGRRGNLLPESRLLRRSAPRNDVKRISIICAPFSAGGPNSAASDGPNALLKAGLKEDLIGIGFDVSVISPPKALLLETKKAMHRKDLPRQVSTKSIKNIALIMKINQWLASVVSEEIKKGRIPLTIGGDHSLAIGTIAGTRDALSDLGVIWIDRHLDVHSPKNTPSWRAHGMPAAVAIADKKFDTHPDFQKLLNIGESKKLPKVKKENFVQIGIGEKSKLNPGTKWYSMEGIDNVGIKKVVDEAFSYLEKRVKKIYIAWDIDAMNVTGTGTSGDDQLTLREGLVIARAVNKLRLKGKLAGFEMMEVAPKLEKKHLKGQTTNHAIQLITTSFGENLFNNYERMTRNINMHAE